MADQELVCEACEQTFTGSAARTKLQRHVCRKPCSEADEKRILQARLQDRIALQKGQAKK